MNCELQIIPDGILTYKKKIFFVVAIKIIGFNLWNSMF